MIPTNHLHLQGTIISQYGGFRFNRGSDHLPKESAQFPINAYRHKIGFGTGILDIPRGFEDTRKYNGTLGHKTNHSFNNNVNITYVSSTTHSEHLFSDMWK